MTDNELKSIAVRAFNNLKSVEIAKNPDASTELEMDVKDILLGFDSKEFMANALEVICEKMDTGNGEESELLPVVLTRTPFMTSNGQWFIEMDADDFNIYFSQ
ncbi:MAG: hypothetical protein HZC47_07770 [Methanobacterium sp.]|uniref:hypothetical protein n=1 Tax=Methanobacterium sp. TaxID=2164 RepID=UPI003D657562|nr:hypothetical protein [Methanobacterium sp.]